MQDWEWLNWAGPTAIALLSFGYTFVSDRRKASAGTIRDLEKKVAAKADAVELGTVIGKVSILENSMTRVEAEMKHLPDRGVVTRLELALAELGGAVGRLDERLKPVAAMADRIQEAMIEKVSRS